jgi:DNA-binding CsgD family transcriptional regulator
VGEYPSAGNASKNSGASPAISGPSDALRPKPIEALIHSLLSAGHSAVDIAKASGLSETGVRNAAAIASQIRARQSVAAAPRLSRSPDSVDGDLAAPSALNLVSSFTESAPPSPPPNAAPKFPLAPFEQEVHERVSSGQSIPQVAAAMGRSAEGVRNAFEIARQKLARQTAQNRPSESPTLPNTQVSSTSKGGTSSTDTVNPASESAIFPELKDKDYVAPVNTQQLLRKIVDQLTPKFEALGTEVEEVGPYRAGKEKWEPGKWLTLTDSGKLLYAPSRVPKVFNRKVFERALDEELDHAAENIAFREEQFEEYLRTGAMKPFRQYKVDTIAPIMNELKSSAQGRQLLQGSLNVYWASLSDSTPLENWPQAEARVRRGDIQIVNFMAEIIRQTVQFRAHGEISESLVYQVSRITAPWLNETLRTMKAAAARPEKISPLLAKSISRVESRLQKMKQDLELLNRIKRDQ